MTAKEAYDLVKKKHPGAKITRMVDYDASSFVLTVLEDGMKERFVDPFVKVNKATGYLSNFLPAAHMKEWHEAISKRTIDITKIGKEVGSIETKRN